MSKKKKLRFALYWAASCGGCEIAVLDINEKILDVTRHADIIFWPVAMDTKYIDIEKMEDKSIDVCFFNGAIRNSENEHIAKLLREKSKILIAFGSCAIEGCIPGLANLSNREDIFKTIYLYNPSTENPDKILPRTRVKVEEGELELPEFYDTVKTLDRVVDVDYYIPGCPPPTKLISDAIDAIIGDKLPPKGSVLAPLKSVCDECPREKSEKKLKELKRVYEVENIDPNICLLEQGIICMGPATRGGCDAICLEANMPCTGCGGPTPNSLDQGAKMISALASVLGIEDEENLSEEDIDKLIDQIKDPVGTFYKYTLPRSIINRRIIK